MTAPRIIIRGDVSFSVDPKGDWVSADNYDAALAEIDRLKAKLGEVARLLDEGAYGMATDEARGA